MHMTGNPEGMFDCKDINEPVILGSGKHLVATKIGKVRKTILQQDGSTQDILLDPIKYVPGLELQLFAVLKALEQGWKLDNNGVKLVLTKGKVRIVFDRVMTTTNGKLVGIVLLPNTGSQRKGEVAMPATEVFTDNKRTKVWDINRLH